MNPRYAAFQSIGGGANWEYLHFIAKMKKLYAESKGGSDTPNNPYPIFCHDDFTLFIKINADRYKNDSKK